MMKTGKCLKCQSDQVYLSVGEGFYDRGSSYHVQLIGKGGVFSRNVLDLITYCCATCGYVEIYAADDVDAKKPQSRAEFLESGKNWQRVDEQ